MFRFLGMPGMADTAVRWPGQPSRAHARRTRVCIGNDVSPLVRLSLLHVEIVFGRRLHYRELSRGRGALASAKCPVRLASGGTAGAVSAHGRGIQAAAVTAGRRGTMVEATEQDSLGGSSSGADSDELRVFEGPRPTHTGDLV